MTFQPLVPLSGYAGWLFLNRTMDSQRQNFDRSPAIDREASYFRENIAKVETADDLIADRTLLKVALEAFGLGEDINHKAFLREVLESKSTEQGSLINRLADKRYLAFSQAFGFGDFGIPLSKTSGFSDRMVDAYRSRGFETAVGNSNPDLRLALSAQREIETIAGREMSDTAKWFSMMGNAPLRKLFETAMGFPKSFGTLPIDRQLDEFRSKANTQFGGSNFSAFSEAETQDKLIRDYLIRSNAGAGNTRFVPGQVALSLLQLAG